MQVHLYIVHVLVIDWLILFLNIIYYIQGIVIHRYTLTVYLPTCFLFLFLFCCLLLFFVCFNYVLSLTLSLIEGGGGGFYKYCLKKVLTESYLEVYSWYSDIYYSSHWFTTGLRNAVVHVKDPLLLVWFQPVSYIIISVVFNHMSDYMYL